MGEPNDQPIYFLHIPKTAGTSVRHWLTRHVPEGALCSAQLWDQLVQLDRRDLASFKVFTGHFGIDLDRYLETDLRTITVLRDPVQRTLSHYLHVHRDTAHPSHWRVSQQSFDVFVQDQQNWPMIENFQARYLVPSGFNMWHFSNRLDLSPEKQYKLSTTSEDMRYLFDKIYVREQALAALDRIDVLGTTSSISAFMKQVEHTFSFASTSADEIPRENVATYNQAVERFTQSSLDLIAELTVIDHLIYETACARQLATQIPHRLS
ncbi:sulfotransferase family 2 domain-containing protein (plasmid) [Lichenicola cladoniae]|uniref:Sulfotransferase family 2 domain-containing protein n=1 Tax=Lichenicola cladoniae TaxID=1484109 RepID=A0A6M8HZ42_9PROT|nr:sulfotransferase family 2 domain-containing protein [Lichenicola cladoniae]NPD69009.1 sulfotransferase family 2 domain-containing protein [Acetobacteraceae bacterium]QKE93361.1 sulfotransferase family 2 domain-containing protein [Lichenicola cladoniae]